MLKGNVHYIILHSRISFAVRVPREDRILRQKNNYSRNSRIRQSLHQMYPPGKKTGCFFISGSSRLLEQKPYKPQDIGQKPAEAIATDCEKYLQGSPAGATLQRNWSWDLLPAGGLMVGQIPQKNSGVIIKYCWFGIHPDQEIFWFNDNITNIYISLPSH
jgi:hypothetical protein